MQLRICLGKYHFNSDIRNFISHITPLCSLLYNTLLKDKYMCLLDVLFKNYDLRSSDVKKPQILTSKFDILRFNGFHFVCVFL